MRRFCRFLLVSALLVLISAGACHAVFPRADGSATFKLNLGWFSGTQAWYICTDTDSSTLARQQKLTFFYAYPTNAAPVYIVTNPPASQGPIFSAAPAPLMLPAPPGPLYSGIWRIIYVKWSTTATKQMLSSESQILMLQGSGQLTLQSTNTAVDYPIIALGSLGAPSYVIPQARGLSSRSVTLPTWNIYCRNFITRMITVNRVIIPDALSLVPPTMGNIDIATLIGANKAPGLFAGPLSKQNDIAAFSWTQPVPPSQYLVAAECPATLSSYSLNSNQNYSPYAELTVLARLPSVRPGIVFNNFSLIVSCSGLATVGSDAVNAPILSSYATQW